MNIPTFREWLDDLFDEEHSRRVLGELSERRVELLEQYTAAMMQQIADALMGGR